MNLNKLNAWLLPLLTAATIFFTCAHKVAPTGGPPDKTPPQVLKTFPQPDSVRVRSIDYIEIEFNEAIRKTSLLNNYWLVPEVGAGLELKWKGGRKVRFYFKAELDSAQTYLFTLGTSIKDLRGNGLSAPYQLAFATGSHLDSASIAGKVYAERPERGVFIYAFPVREPVWDDSLVFTRARYYTQIDDKGSFIFSRLPFGKYRLLALLDQDYNQVYNITADKVGFPAQDVKLDSTRPVFTGLNFFLTNEDTSAPRIRSVDTLNSRQLSVRFDEDIAPAQHLSAVITDSSSGQLVPLRGLSFDEQKNAILLVYPDSLQWGRKYHLTLKGIRDRAGNISDGSRVSAYFSAARETDTTSASLVSCTPANGSENIDFSTEITLLFNQPVDTVRYQKHFVLESGNSHRIAGRFHFLNLLKPVFQPDSLLFPDTEYQVRLALDSLNTLFGESVGDSTFRSVFRTRPMDDLGEISGRVNAPGVPDKPVLITATALKDNSIYRTQGTSDSEYILRYLPKGDYKMQAVLDLNENGCWDKGSSLPWQFAEPFIIRPDTVSVRARWTRDGINFYFPEN